MINRILYERIVPLSLGESFSSQMDSSFQPYINKVTRQIGCFCVGRFDRACTFCDGDDENISTPSLIEQVVGVYDISFDQKRVMWTDRFSQHRPAIHLDFGK